MVIHEYNQVASTVMDKGECSIQDEVLCEDGKETAVLVGGRRGEKFVRAWRTPDGLWPTVPNNQRRINLILAAVRAGQDVAGRIIKHIDRRCFVTDTGRCVATTKMSFSAQASTAKRMDAQALMDTASGIKQALDQMEPDADGPHLGLLVDSMYWDEEAEDTEQRIRYLNLWQSLEEARKKLGYPQRITLDTKDIVAGEKTLGELKGYRHSVAHHWTDTSDQQALRDVQLTVNELMRRKYFKPKGTQ